MFMWPRFLWGADKNQTLKAIAEAEAYDGPSLIIAYAPCINHGLKAGMGCSQLEAKLAVDCGYWATYRYNPALKEKVRILSYWILKSLLLISESSFWAKFVILPCSNSILKQLKHCSPKLNRMLKNV